MTCACGPIILSLAAAFLLWTASGIAQDTDDRFSRGTEKAKRATVGILDVRRADQTGPSHFIPQGSGFHIGGGYIITARHVTDRDETGRLLSPKEVRVMTTELDELSATLIGVNAFLDIAVYRMTPEGIGLSHVKFADKEPASGEELFTVGYPLGWGPAMGFGRLGNPNTYIPTVETRLFQVDLSACSGNSGGGLFNADGNIVGVVHAIIQTETAQGEARCSRFAFAVPGPLVQRIVTALMAGEQPGFSKLGVQLTVVKIGTRWRVAVLEAGGAALEGGLHKGDILLAIDDTEIKDAVQLKNYLIEHTVPGQKVSVKVLRGQTEHIQYVTLGKS